MMFLQLLEESALKTEEYLNSFFALWREKVAKLDQNLLPLADAAIEANKGGKKLRASLVRLGYELFSSKLNPEIYRCGAAFEIFQTAILSHDDIIDKSQLRRGKPTIFS